MEVGSEKGEGRREQERRGLSPPSIQGTVLGWNPQGRACSCISVGRTPGSEAMLRYGLNCVPPKVTG